MTGLAPDGPAAALTAPTTLRALTTWLPARRWFDGTGRPLASVSVIASHLFAGPDGPGQPAGAFVVVRATDITGVDAGSYVLTLGAERTDAEGARTPSAVVARHEGLTVYDALDDPRLVNTLIRHTALERDLDGVRYRAEPPGFVVPREPLPVRDLGAEQSNSSVVVDDRFILKVLRRMSPGPSPDLMLHRLLRDAGSVHVTPLLGAVEDAATEATFATLQEFLPKAEDGWAAALMAVHQLLAGDPSDGDFTTDAGNLGRALAAVHRDLADAAGSTVLRREDYALLSRQFRHRLDRAVAATALLGPYTDRLAAVFAAVAELAPDERRRAHLTHGDLHLGQTLRTAEGWLVLDFEGEPMAGAAERRRHHSPLRDVAGMLRSFDYVAHHQLTDPPASDARRERARHWVARNQTAFLAGYADGSGQDPTSDLALLRAYELDKAVYEVLYETQHRPSWAWIPLQALDRCLASRVV
ncbi:maltokinase N-terminal cap-like domain-containing protein [Streptomyces sp. enrichment culture]|uniref:maltokinase N-terminal cap-like domain-containing protein n=1 Tax=Streptomyces sp. enrichment culture TaxID=1795815 RepID=UPI003F543CE6